MARLLAAIGGNYRTQLPAAASFAHCVFNFVQVRQ
jgi:hypothetical protein